MKKLLALVLVLVLCFSFAACTIEEEPDVASNSAVESTSSAVTSTVKNNEKLENLIKAQDATLDATRESYKDVMTIDLEARGNSVVYKYTYIVDTGDTDVLKVSLDSGIKQQEETFKNSLTLMRAGVPEIESMIVEYYDMNKKLIASYEFK